MQSNFKLLDIVALTVDLPNDNLWRGQVGTVVEILANGQAFEVEFSDRSGRTYESFEPALPDTKTQLVTA